jgi:hypothetical protein
MIDSFYLIHLWVWLIVNEMQGNVISDTAHVMSALSYATGDAEAAVSEHHTRWDFHYCRSLFSILCDDRFKASSKTIPPHSAI